MVRSPHRSPGGAGTPGVGAVTFTREPLRRVRRGGVAERTKATVLKTVEPGNRFRGFESHPLRVSQTHVRRERVMADRVHANHLARRLPPGSLAVAARGGLQDSAPRSGVLSLHARVDEVGPNSVWDDDLVQVWGPRQAVYVVPARDVDVFTLGLLPRDRVHRRAIEADAAVVTDLLEAGVTEGGKFEAALGGSVRRVRRTAATGLIRIRWEPNTTTIWRVERPAGSSEAARRELARRFLHVHGPSTPADFAAWAGIRATDARLTWAAIIDELVVIQIDGSDFWLPAADEAALINADRAESVRLLPPGDSMLSSPGRHLLLRDGDKRDVVWPPSGNPPGALMAHGELVGTWRRRGRNVLVSPWDVLSPRVRAAVELEVATFPVAPVNAFSRVAWS